MNGLSGTVLLTEESSLCTREVRNVEEKAEDIKLQEIIDLDMKAASDAAMQWLREYYNVNERESIKNRFRDER